MSDRRLLHDRFERDVRRGRVVGSTSPAGAERLGVDRFRSMAVDHGALRIISLRRPGWGSTSLAYGRLEPHHGLAFAAYLLNGHNTAQSEPLGEPLVRRFKRWLQGNEVEPWKTHAIRWVLHGRRAWTVRRFAHWVRVDLATRRGSLPRLDENLLTGFAPEVASDPAAGGNAFVMHATGADNGELWVAAAGATRSALTGVRNVPLYLLVVVRDDHAIHFAGSLAGVRGLPPVPQVRPLAIVPLDGSSRYGVVHQSVSGQIGFAADTRVWETVVAEVDGWLRGEGAPVVSEDLTGLNEGDRTGWTADGGAGLIRVTGEPDVRFAVTFRGAGPDHWGIRAGGGTLELRHTSYGTDTLVAETDCGGNASSLDVQVIDDGRRFGVVVDGTLAFDRWFDRPEGADGTEGAVELGSGRLHHVEVYTRQCDLPPALVPATSVVRPSHGLRTVVVDEFDGPEQSLDGRLVGDGAWTRTGADGRFLLTGSGALRVDASSTTPLPGRVSYTFPFTTDGPVEIEIDVLPPGTDRGQGEKGRAGVVFEQDDGNALYVATWLDDEYDGASISSFFGLGGFEDLYDAIWTNVGERVRWGHPYRLRVAFDGLVYEAFVDDELVLYRSLVDIEPSQQPLAIRRVGIVANWEWGTDTGSTFRRFRLRGADSTGRDRH